MNKLTEYLPEFLKEYKVLTDILQVEEDCLKQMEEDALFLLENAFILSSSEYGLNRYEKMLNLKPFKNDTLEDRKKRILSFIDTALPYTLEVLEQKIKNLIGDDFTYSLSSKTHTFKIDFVVDRMSKGIMLEDLLDAYLPANVLIDAENKIYYKTENDLYADTQIVFTQKIYIK